MRAKAIEIAAHVMEAAPDDLEIVDRRGRSARHTESERSRSTRSRTSRISRPRASPRGWRPGSKRPATFKAPPFSWSNACHACTVEVDRNTGVVTILRYVVSEDCGVMINPMIVEGQIAGGVVQGIGGALYEHVVYDDDGNPLTTTFMDYLLPTAAEVPTSSTGTSRRRRQRPAATRAWARAARSARRPPCSTPSPTRSRSSALDVDRTPLSPDVILTALSSQPA